MRHSQPTLPVPARRRLLRVFVVLAVALLIAGCGGSEDRTDTTIADDESTTTEASATSEDSEDTDTSAVTTPTTGRRSSAPSSTLRPPAPEAEDAVVGSYVKNATSEPLTFTSGLTTIKLDQTEGEVALELRAGGEAVLQGDRSATWELDGDEITLTIAGFNPPPAATGTYEDGQILGLGGDDVVWQEQ